MASETNKTDDDEPSDKAKHAQRVDQPEWADGLKQLYDSVVDEPLPDSFKDLLSQLDSDETSSASQSDNG